MSDIKIEVIQKTQKILGKYVRKPPLTDKLLRKPPFRFLHDIINSVIAETGFLNGLFNEDEMKSENVKDKEAKLAYLNKVIDAIKTITGKNLSVRASKIIAGLEPIETNLLLQTIGKALDKKLDSSEYIAGLNDKKKPTNQKIKTKKSDINKTTKKEPGSVKSEEQPKAKKRTSKTDQQEVKKKSTGSDRKQRSKKDDKSVTPKSKDAESKVKKSPKVAESPKQNEFDILTSSKKEEHKNSVEKEVERVLENELNNSDDVQPEKVQDIVSIDNEKVNSEEVLSSLKDTNKSENQMSVEPTEKVKYERSERPKSARPTSGDHKKELVKPKERNEKHAVPEIIPVQQRPKSSLRPPSVRPSSARPGAPRLRPDSSLPMKEMVTMGKINVIVENFTNKDADDDETVVIQTAEEVDDFRSPVILDMPESKGHLVEQILEQIEDAKDLPKRKTEIDWDLNGQQRGREAVNKEVEQLRLLIQTLTRTANPLGKLLNYLHEDIEAMYSELEMWINTKRQIKSEIKKQKLITEESVKPLKTTLQQLQEDISKQEQEILNVRSSILRNEMQIKKFLN